MICTTLTRVDKLCLIYVGESWIIENVSILSKIISVVEDTSSDSCPSEIASGVENTSVVSCLLPSSLDGVHVSLADTTDASDIVNVLMEYSIPITDKINVQEDNHNS